jgi:hypothetical protein
LQLSSKNYLQNKSSIRSLLALMLLLVFTISTTPRRYWHDIFAGHTDTAVCDVPLDGKHHLRDTGIQCDCNKLVATSPFTEQDEVVLPVIPRLFFTPGQTALSSVILAPVTRVHAQRGPPALA